MNYPIQSETTVTARAVQDARAKLKRYRDLIRCLLLYATHSKTCAARRDREDGCACGLGFQLLRADYILAEDAGEVVK